MKGKITIVLFSLVLVFGMLAASCDNGSFPKQDDKDASTYFAYETDAKNLPKTTLTGKLPKLLKPEDVYAALTKEIAYTTNGTTWTIMKANRLATVPTPPKGVTYNEAENKLANRFRGMQIIVANDVPDAAIDTMDPEDVEDYLDMIDELFK